MSGDDAEVFFNVIKNIPHHGLCNPFNFHSYRRVTIFVSSTCLVCNATMFPWNDVTYCIKCAKYCHRTCMRSRKFICESHRILNQNIDNVDYAITLRYAIEYDNDFWLHKYEDFLSSKSKYQADIKFSRSFDQSEAVQSALNNSRSFLYHLSHHFHKIFFLATSTIKNSDLILKSARACLDMIALHVMRALPQTLLDSASAQLSIYNSIDSYMLAVDDNRMYNFVYSAACNLAKLNENSLRNEVNFRLDECAGELQEERDVILRDPIFLSTAMEKLGLVSVKKTGLDKLAQVIQVLQFVSSQVVDTTVPFGSTVSTPAAISANDYDNSSAEENSSNITGSILRQQADAIVRSDLEIIVIDKTQIGSFDTVPIIVSKLSVESIDSAPVIINKPTIEPINSPPVIINRSPIESIDSAPVIINKPPTESINSPPIIVTKPTINEAPVIVSKPQLEEPIDSAPVIIHKSIRNEIHCILPVIVARPVSAGLIDEIPVIVDNPSANTVYTESNGHFNATKPLNSHDSETSIQLTPAAPIISPKLIRSQSSPLSQSSPQRLAGRTISDSSLNSSNGKPNSERWYPGKYAKVVVNKIKEKSATRRSNCADFSIPNAEVSETNIPSSNDVPALDLDETVNIAHLHLNNPSDENNNLISEPVTDDGNSVARSLDGSFSMTSKVSSPGVPAILPESFYFSAFKWVPAKYMSMMRRKDSDTTLSRKGAMSTTPDGTTIATGGREGESASVSTEALIKRLRYIALVTVKQATMLETDCSLYGECEFMSAMVPEGDWLLGASGYALATLHTALS